MISAKSEQAVISLGLLADLWERRLTEEWTPPPGSAFPWAQVRLSLAALLPGMRRAGEWVEKALFSAEGEGAKTLALILAGNTPLMSWSPLCACLLAGVEQIQVKMSRDEVLWPSLFVESLAEVDPEMAARVELNVWPGDDPRTTELVRSADAVIAYGSDRTLTELRALVPAETPFFGFGHAVSLAVLSGGEGANETFLQGLATDILMYSQQGCLSPHVVYCHPADIKATSDALTRYLAEAATRLEVTPVGEAAVATAVRNARDMALFAGHEIRGEDALRWTVIQASEPLAHPAPVGQGVVYMSPCATPEELVRLIEPVHGKISAVACSEEREATWRQSLTGEGISWFCRPGEMQTPPLDWPNGNIDLLAELLHLRRREEENG